jgi:hypothetical protein
MLAGAAVIVNSGALGDVPGRRRSQDSETVNHVSGMQAAPRPLFHLELPTAHGAALPPVLRRGRLRARAPVRRPPCCCLRSTRQVGMPLRRLSRWHRRPWPGERATRRRPGRASGRIGLPRRQSVARPGWFVTGGLREAPPGRMIGSVSGHVSGQSGEDFQYVSKGRPPAGRRARRRLRPSACAPPARRQQPGPGGPR